MQLVLFSIRRQFDENPLASKLLMLLIYRSKAKELLARIHPIFLRAPYYSVTINRKPEKNLHILQCDGDLTMWHMEGESRVAIAPLRPLLSHCQSLYPGS